VTLAGHPEQLGDLERGVLHVAVARQRGEEVPAACSVSSTVRSGKIWTSWKLRAIPSFASRTGPNPVTSRSLKRTVPAVGFDTPVSRLISVDLPAPLGPMIDTNSPRRMARLTPSSAQNGP
jgi:hypothetical protein